MRRLSSASHPCLTFTPQSESTKEVCRPMKKWSLLSIPLVGFAGITVWAQAVAGAPTGHEPGVIVTEGAPRHSVQKLDESTENRRLSPATDPAATPQTTSPALKVGSAERCHLLSALHESRGVQRRICGTGPGHFPGTGTHRRFNVLEPARWQKRTLQQQRQEWRQQWLGVPGGSPQKQFLPARRSQ